MENQLSINQALAIFNPEFLRVNPCWDKINPFRVNLLDLLNHTEELESEEFHKNLISNFLKKTYYNSNHFINTKARYDLVIHRGKSQTSSVGVILEFKSPQNKAEMPRGDRLNVKALQQLLFYFLQERLIQKNFELKHLVITNCYQWFIFNAQDFERFFVNDQALVKQFREFTSRELTGTRVDFFYENIAKPAIAAVESELRFTYFDLRNYQAILEKTAPEQELSKPEEQELIALFKIFAPEYLLKLPFANDSNSLNRAFYHELLHIMGLTETKQGSKKLIERKPESQRDRESLLENTIGAIKTQRKLSRLSRLDNAERFGELEQKQFWEVALELTITWVNRILFLKLLEAQLIRYYGGDRTVGFLNVEKIPNYYVLNELFFDVLARQPQEREQELQERFSLVPYLNSSLFEPTDLELEMIVISNLHGQNLPLFSGTVLRDHTGDRLTGSKPTLAYLFEFLDAYDFGSEHQEGIKEDNKDLINSSVLGKIFEKINGYQDGSFFTPSLITMYMCRQTIRAAILQKFNQVKGWNCQNLVEVHNKIEDINEANEIINSLKICDPAVGSGHFLVSALNEIITVKSELKILSDRSGRLLRDYQARLRNDELIIVYSDGNQEKQFFYDPHNQESQRVQETLFHEKQTIIENCLFGVDINENSAQICRLRLWIELLKYAYYKSPLKSAANRELETLPNIDINVKRGNSLISRFPLDGDLEPALRKNELDIVSYRNAVKTYRNAESKEQKQEMKDLIDRIKKNCKMTLFGTDLRKTKLRQLEAELYNLENQTSLFEGTKQEYEKKIAKLKTEVSRLKLEIKEVESGRIYDNSLEWRFEFPEVLNDQGDFIGFDLVIGNPPYINAKDLVEKQSQLRDYLSHHSNYSTLHQKWDIYIPFIEKMIDLMNGGLCAFIIPYPYLNQTYAKFSREFLVREHTLLEIVDLSSLKVFEEAMVTNCIIFYKKAKIQAYQIKISKFGNEGIEDSYLISSDAILGNNSVISLEKRATLTFNNDSFKPLGDLCFLSKGMVLNADEHKAKGKFVKQELISNVRSTVHSKLYVEAKNIDRYQVNTIRFLEWNTKRVPPLISRPTFEGLYECPKIIINKIGKIKATYDDNQLFCDQTIRIAVLWHDLSGVENKSINNSVTKFSQYNRQQLEAFSRQINLKFILGILNSHLSNYLLDNIRGVGNIDLNPEYLKNIPIPYISPVDQEPLIQLVEQILDTKKANPQAETIALEKEIDRLVYQLYGLTDEKITMIENTQLKSPY